LLASIVGKYNDRDPLYLLFGDFNLCLERTLNGDILPDILRDWQTFPTREQRGGRGLRPQQPIDYVLVRQPERFENITPETSEFSILPLGECQQMYYFPMDPKLCSSRAVIHKEALRYGHLRRTSLSGFPPFLNVAQNIEDEFERNKNSLIYNSTLIFDHDFLFFKTFVPKGVSLPTYDIINGFTKDEDTESCSNPLPATLEGPPGPAHLGINEQIIPALIDLPQLAEDDVRMWTDLELDTMFVDTSSNVTPDVEKQCNLFGFGPWTGM